MRTTLFAAFTLILSLLSSCGGGDSGGNNSVETTDLLKGDDAALIVDAIPNLQFKARTQDYSTDHPELGGMPVSFNTLAITFTLGTTAGDIRALLVDINAEIVGGVSGNSSGVLLVRTPLTTHEEMIDLLQELAQNPIVANAAPDVLLAPNRVPKDNTDSSNPPNWNWQPGGNNWGLEQIRAPQMWNFNDSITKAGTVSPKNTGVLDFGFVRQHDDLQYGENLTPDVEGEHGTHVAGIISATYNNAMGVVGINPFSSLVVQADTGSWAGSMTNIKKMSEEYPFVDVINMSMGYAETVDTNASTARQNLANSQGAIMADALRALGNSAPIIVASAGNKSNDFRDDNGDYILQEARYASPMNNAALEHGYDSIIVVESVNKNATRSELSNINGHVSAPGEAIWSTILSNGYGQKNGTSMAAPHVTGLIGYMLAIEPTLTHAEIKQLLISNATPVAGGASPRIDAWKTIMDIDRVQQNTNVLKRLLDIDDGTLDGNLRFDAAGIAADNTNEDADNDGGIGDGVVDMSDFRRWRDWLIQIDNPEQADLNGSDTLGTVDSGSHPKKDINGNSSVEPAEKENLYPRGDFNGDGKLDPTATDNIQGVTDLMVFQRLFTDPHYSATDLDGLLNSGDIEVWPLSCFLREDVTQVVSILLDSTGTEIDRHTHIHEDPQEQRVYTVDTGTYTVQTEAQNADGETVFTAEKQFEVQPGGDDLFDQVSCSDLVIEITLAASVEPGTATPIVIRAGLAQNDGTVLYQPFIDIELNPNVGSVNPQSGNTDADGFFLSELTTPATFEVFTLFVTANSIDGAEAEATAEITNNSSPDGIIIFGGLDFESSVSTDCAGSYGYDSNSAESNTPADASTILNQISLGLVSGGGITEATMSGTATFEFTESSTTDFGDPDDDLLANAVFRVNTQSKTRANAPGDSNDSTPCGGGSAEVSFDYHFIVPVTIPFTITGNIIVRGNASSDRAYESVGIRLTRQNGAGFTDIIYATADQAGGTISLSESGLLEPASYDYELFCGADNDFELVTPESLQTNCDVIFSLGL